MIYAIRGDILQAYQDYVGSIKAIEKPNTSADGWKYAKRKKNKK